MAERTIFIRSEPLRVVVKPFPHGMANVNRLNIEERGEAEAYAAELSEQHGWSVVDET
jgi:hypothetical protein